MEARFNTANIDIKRKKKIVIRLEDSSGAEVDMQEIITQVNSYVLDQLNSGERNICIDQIFPLVTQLLNRSIETTSQDYNLAMLLMSQHLFRNTLISQMMITFYFLKFIQKNDIKIISMEEDINQEEIDRLMTTDRISGFSIAALNMGMPIKEIVKILLETGQVTREDLIEAGLIKENFEFPEGDKGN